MSHSRHPIQFQPNGGNPWILWKFKLLFHRVKYNALKASLWFYVVVTVGLFASAWYVMSRFESEKTPDLMTFLYWFVTTISTVGYGDISPATTPGRLITMLVMLLGIGLFSIIAGTLITLVINLKTQILKGLRKVMLENHIVILGYHPIRTKRMIEEINADCSAKIVLVSDDLQENPFPKYIEFVRGDIAQEEDIARASIQTARGILIYGRDDNQTLAAAIIVNQAARPDCRIVAYAADPKRAPLIRGVSNRIAVIISTAVEAMIQEMQDPGTSGLISDILAYSKSQNCYRIEVGQCHGTYGDIACRLKQTYDIQAIGIWDDQTQEALENPPSRQSISPGDMLFVIARERPTQINWGQLKD